MERSAALRALSVRALIRRLSAWQAATLVYAMVALITVLLWWAARATALRDTTLLVDARGAEIAAHVTGTVDTRLHAVERFATRWRLAGTFDERVWTEEARVFLDTLGDVTSLELQDLSGERRLTAFLNPSSAGTPREPDDAELRARAVARIAQVTSDVRSLAGGGIGLVAYYPTRWPPDERGLLRAILPLSALAASLTRLPSSADLAVQMWRDQRLLFAQGRPVRESAWTQARFIDVGDGQWWITVAPTAALEARQEGPSSTVLFAGLVLAALVGGVIGLANTAKGQGLELTRRTEERDVETQRRRQTERELEGVLESLPEALLIVDEAGRIVRVNAQAEMLFRTDRAALVGAPVEHLVPERFRPLHAAHRADYASLPRTRLMGGRPMTALRADGTEFPADISLGALATPSGFFVSCTVVDVTERRRAEDALQTALSDRETLLKEVYHRVKNNLQVVHGLLRLHGRAVTDPQAAAVLLESSQRVRAMALVHEMLYGSRGLDRIELGSYVSKLADQLVASHMQARRVSLVTELEPIAVGLSTAIPCGLILNELVSNALKHAFVDDRPGEIRIGLQRVDGGAIRLVVSDNGRGLPAEFLPGERSTLGMELVSTLTGQLGGTLVSTSDGGARFILTFEATGESAYGASFVEQAAV